MATVRKSPKGMKKKSPPKILPGTIRKITPLRKTKTPTSKIGFRSTRKTTTPKKGNNILSRSVIAKTSATRSKKSTPLILGSKSTPKKTPTKKGSPKKTTPGRTTPGRTTPGRTTPGRTTPGRTTPGRTTPGRTTPGRTTPKKTTPGRISRKGSPKSLASLKPKTPVKKTGTTLSGKLSPRNQFLYITLSICAGLLLFVLILFGFYKLYEYFNPSEKTTTDNIDFMEELEDVETQAKETEETPEEDKVAEE